MVRKLRQKYQAQYGRYEKPIIFIGIVFFIFVIYQFYNWINTQSTDNAYVESDISLVSSEINGKIQKIYLHENQEAKTEDLVVEIDETEYKANLNKIIAEILSAENKIQITDQKIVLAKLDIEKLEDGKRFAEINFNLIKHDYDRIVELVKGNYSSKKNMDDITSKFEKAGLENRKAKLDLDTSKENLKLLGVQQKTELAILESLKQEKIKVENQLSHTKITSPIDGIIADSHLRIGNFVRVGTPLFSVVPTKNLYIKANFKETQIVKFKPGMIATIKFDVAPNVKIYGTIRNIAPAVGAKFSLLPQDNATGNFTKVVQRISVLINFVLPEELQNKVVAGMSSAVSIKINQ